VRRVVKLLAVIALWVAATAGPIYLVALMIGLPVGPHTCVDRDIAAPHLDKSMELTVVEQNCDTIGNTTFVSIFARRIGAWGKQRIFRHAPWGDDDSPSVTILPNNVIKIHIYHIIESYEQEKTWDSRPIVYDIDQVTYRDKP
jgi:hypothetical protein